MTFLEYGKIASATDGFSSLFIDYVDHFERVAQYYAGNFREQSVWKERIAKVARRKIDRAKIAGILSRQNRDFHCGIRTLENIDLLRSENTVAIVTGQQVGLFTGPLYTLYKTLTAIRLASDLSQKFPDYQFVPVFWLEGEDHDAVEMGSTGLINQQNEFRTLSYQFPEINPPRNLGSVGSLVFSESLNAVFTEAESMLPETDYRTQVLTLFKKAYQPGMSFNTAFVLLFGELLEDSGLIFLNPADREIKQMLQPLFTHELQTTPSLCQLVIEQSYEIEKAYHAQVKPQPVNLFMQYEGGRYLIDPKGDEFSLKGILKKRFTKTELLDIAASQPELFSPNVLLRPLAQDTLLPTAAYVAGPSEVAYFAQYKPLYEALKIPMPIIYPRASITLVEDKVQKIVSKYSLAYDDFFKKPDDVKEKVLRIISELHPEALFAQTERTISESGTALKDRIVAIDPTLAPVYDKTLERIVQSLEQLKGKVIEAEKRLNENTMRQVERSSMHLFPHGNLQEREVNILYYANKYGLEFVRWLKEQIKIDVFKHQVLPIQ